MADIDNNLPTDYFFIYDLKSERYVKENSTPENCEWTRKYTEFMYFSMDDIKNWKDFEAKNNLQLSIIPISYSKNVLKELGYKSEQKEKTLSMNEIDSILADIGKS